MDGIVVCRRSGARRGLGALVQAACPHATGESERTSAPIPQHPGKPGSKLGDRGRLEPILRSA